MDAQEQAIELFAIAEKKIEAVRMDVSEMVRHDTELQIKMDRLTDRVDNGISVTAQKTLAIVTELSTQIAAYRIEQEQTKREVATHDKLLDRLITSVFVTATVGVVGGLVALFFGLIKYFSRGPV